MFIGIFNQYKNLIKMIDTTTRGYFGSSKKNLPRTLMAGAIIAIELLNAFLFYQLTQYSGLIDESLRLRQSFSELTTACFKFLGAQIFIAITNHIKDILMTGIVESLSRDKRNDIAEKWLEVHYPMAFDKLTADITERSPAQALVFDVTRLSYTAINTAHAIVSLPIKFFTVLYNLVNISGTLPAKYLGVAIPGYMIYPVIFWSLLANKVSTYIGEKFGTLHKEQLSLIVGYNTYINSVQIDRAPIASMRSEPYERNNLERISNSLYDKNLTLYAWQKILKEWGLFQTSINFALAAILSWPKFQNDTSMTFGVWGVIQKLVNSFAEALGFHNKHREVIITAEQQTDRIEDLKQRIDRWKNQVKGRGIQVFASSESSNFSVKDLTVFIPGYGDKESKKLLDNAGLSLETGKWYRLQGPSGIGKSTLLTALWGIWPYSKGEVVYPVSDMKKVKFLSQKPLDVRVGQSLMERIAYPDPVQEIANKEKVKGLMRKFNLSEGIINCLDDTDKNWSQLSGGEKNKINIISALIRDPKFLIMDESMNGIGENDKKIIINTIKARGITVIFVDHALITEVLHDYDITIEDGKLHVRDAVKSDLKLASSPNTRKRRHKQPNVVDTKHDEMGIQTNVIDTKRDEIEILASLLSELQSVLSGMPGMNRKYVAEIVSVSCRMSAVKMRHTEGLISQDNGQLPAR